MVTIIVYLAITVFVSMVLWSVAPISVKKRISPTAGMSVASKHLYKEYKALPEDSRPFPDVARILRQLDERFVVDQADLNNHFKAKVYSSEPSYVFSWNDSQGRCHHTKCKYSDYVDMHRAIEKVASKVADRERLEHNARTAGAADMAKELTEALRREADIQEQVIRELY